MNLNKKEQKNLRLSLITLILCIVMSMFGGCSVNRTIKKADKKYDIGEYFKASNIYRQAYPRVNVSKEKQKKAYVAMRMGDCYSKIGETEKAERSFSNAVRYNYSDTTVYLMYAEILRKQKKYKEAIANYDIYLKKDSTNTIAINRKKSAEEVSKWSKINTRYTVKKEPFFIGKKSSDVTPSYPGGDSTVIYFASSRDNKQTSHKISNITGTPNKDIYMAKRNAVGEWDNLELIETDMNTVDDEVGPSFSTDGKVIVFTRCRYVKGENHGGEIWSAMRSGGKWGKATRIMPVKDSTVTVAHPALSPDGKYLYFVSDMPGGYGGTDIWRCEKTADGEYLAATNLGPTINTSGNEKFPFVREDSTLYFSSDGHPGLGGMDIFAAKEVSDNVWEVRNMLTPINSNDDEIGITFAKGAESGMFSSNRGERKGFYKIYSFVAPPMMYEISGIVRSSDGEVLGDANIRIVGNDGTNVKVKSKKDGTFKYPLKKGVEYVLLGNCRGYLNQKDNVSTVDLEDSQSFDVNFTLASVTKPVGLDNIFFEFGQATLTKESGAALDKLVKLLKDNPNITIEIGAHTDKVGSAEGNLKLSGERAQSVVDYLVKGGIEADRLTAKGYGKTQPVVVDKNISKEYPFLKVGDELSEEFIDNLDPEKQEVANKINRRTEFRVLKTTYKMY